MSYGEKASQIFEKMIELGYLPKEGDFEITEELIRVSHDIGEKLFHVNGRKQQPSSIRFRKRIAGLTLQALREERNQVKFVSVIKPERLKDRSGFVYIVKNPTFKDWFKLGITKDISSRLSTYQTADPNRAFYVHKKIFVADTRKIEKDLLNRFGDKDYYSGEWLQHHYLSSVERVLDSF